MNVLHNSMNPGDGDLTIPFLDISVLTSASLTMLGLKLAVSLLLDSLLPGEAEDVFFYNSEQLDMFPDQADYHVVRTESISQPDCLAK